MNKEAHFSVHTRLTRILGETYRSSEVAIKELVDNAWDADAQHVWINLPDPLSNEAIVVRDDGTGMTSREIRSEYLNIASDKRTRTGERTPVYRRKVKGRKGIGKFAGLTIANKMEISTAARGYICTIIVDKQELIDNQNDLEAVPLPFTEAPQNESATGTTITLSSLDDRLNFPNPDRLREVLIQEYGREDRFIVSVNGTALSVDDVPGQTSQAEEVLPNAGNINLHFTIADSKRLPKLPGIILKVDGKAVGRPLLFGLDQDDEIPTKLARRVYGEVNLSGLSDFVTADWGGFIENSKAFQEVQTYVQLEIKKGLKDTHAREMNLQQARLKNELRQRLMRLPEHRRQYAEEALNRILRRFYGESDERVSTIASVALDAMEHDAYWAVFERISVSSRSDVWSFAESLEQFGLVELSSIAQQAVRRVKFLDFFDQLANNPDTLEKDVHKALETNLWILGRNYSAMSSNATLRTIVETYCGTSLESGRASKRPDLLLSQRYGDAYLLIEFKRPNHSISREDIAQAEKYRDDLCVRLSSTTKMEIMMIGKGRVNTLDTKNLLETIKINSYASVISNARSELEWLIASLSNLRA
ncbi:ATP-binding protein [Chelatococcus asaccharovorans]|uniref:Histidine kinase/DNA gyrase B/HSP90-like ATPase n=1 Tax=Chelatococcus asaccharovorans TaxID=28210 RepID=A0A2V3UDY4_9HYPH|nr:ATP-binding protein [Chelatococcus asaccharovorans]MBS7707060.1 ATP-binding protein [Chelatococcus asaccharovorans]PXW63240.1 histidine kinase/DNA gyrase B/HSP90-like ATPase [Chelatococcus asaccharovorans]